MSSKKTVAALFVGLYFLAAGISYATFSYALAPNDQSLINPSPLTPAQTEQARAQIDTNEPKTEICPLNGALFGKSSKTIWDTRRPLAVMIENHQEARPQSGLNSADVVYEALAEGGITRFMAVFLCDAAAKDIDVGPVRSARTYFLDWVSEYTEFPIYAHVGGANCNATTGSGCANGAKADAIGQIRKYGWNLYNDLNQMIGGDVGIKVFRRDNRLEKYTGNQNIAIEHTMYSSTDKLWGVAEKRGLTHIDKNNVAWDAKFVPWKFKADEASSSPTASKISYTFWDQFANDYAVSWQYDAATNSYLRSNGGVAHLDLNTKKQISAKTVVVAYMKEARADDGYENNLHLVYTNKGSGNAIIFQDGTMIEGNWRKKDRLSRTQFFTKAGKEIELNSGKIWISVLPDRNEKKIEIQ